MPSNEEQIRTLIHEWAKAVHTGDLDTVLADHADDIVMFDVPPPDGGVRGIDAYRETWPPFFQWQAQGARFEIESLDVTAGEDVAFAYALLRCGTDAEFAEHPERRLRLTLGLRKQDGRWVVTHEHHSFPLTDGQDGTDGPDETAEQQVRQVHQRWFDDTAAGDLDGLMRSIADDVVSYEQEGQLEYVGVDAVREVCRQGLESSGGAKVRFDIPDLKVMARGDLAVAWGLNHITVNGRESPSRGTRVFQHRDGKWLLIHQHVSVPASTVDIET